MARVAGQPSGDQGAQDGASGQHGDQPEEQEQKEQEATPLDGGERLAGRRFDERPVGSHVDRQFDQLLVDGFQLTGAGVEVVDGVGQLEL